MCTARIAVTIIAMNKELGIQCVFWFLFTIVCLLCQPVHAVVAHCVNEILIRICVHVVVYHSVCV